MATGNLVEFAEFDVTAQLTSPRSLRACAKEGVEPADLIYKPMESFAEKGLEPRLVKLRYDFFEAKRKDLLTACRRARSQMVARDERLNPEGAKPPTDKPMTSSMVAAASALESDTIRLEKHKLARVQANERRWLQSALGAELESLRKLEQGSQQAAQEAADDSAAEKAASDRRKAESDRKKEQEHQRALEQQAQQQLERELARQEFEKEQEEQHRKQLAERKRRKEQHKREIAEAERKVAADREKIAAQERAWQRQQERIMEMEKSDEERRELMEEQKMEQKRLMEERQRAKNDRIAKSVENNMELEQKKEDDFQQKLAENKERNDRLEEERRLFQEAAAKRSLQMLLKRKHIADESNRRLEQKRQDLLEHAEDVEHRLMEHETKKQRYLEFKRELDGLKEKNKLLNVGRMRRRSEFKREQVAESCRQKTMKADMTVLERQRLWDERRMTALLSQKARDNVRGLILHQKIKSDFNTESARNLVGEIFADPHFNPKVEHSQSLPSLPKM
jgi:hypothetical protein